MHHRGDQRDDRERSLRTMAHRPLPERIRRPIVPSSIGGVENDDGRRHLG